MFVLTEIRKFTSRNRSSFERGPAGPCQKRATCLALSLLMLRIFADHHYTALSANDLALLAHGLHGRSYFHVNKPPTYYAR